MNANSESRTPVSFFRAFNEHPASVNETYFQHLRFAFSFAGKLFLAGSAATVHAVIPALFETTASRQVKEIHELLVIRHKPVD